MDEQLTYAIARLEKFFGRFFAGNPIDDNLALTADDVKMVVEAAKRGAQVVAIRRLDLGNLEKP